MIISGEPSTGKTSTILALAKEIFGIENYKDRSKKIIFKKSDAITYIYKTRITFDLILIKQTIHLLQTAQIIKLLSVCKNKLNPGGCE